MEFQVGNGDGDGGSTNEDVIPNMFEFDGSNLNEYYSDCQLYQLLLVVVANGFYLLLLNIIIITYNTFKF